MLIIASHIIEDARQRDGRRYIREQHIDYLGIRHERNYLAEAAQIIDLGAGAALIDIGLSEQELSMNESDVMNADI